MAGSNRELAFLSLCAGKVGSTYELPLTSSCHWNYFLAVFFARTADERTSDAYAEADAEDGGLGLLRCEGGAGVARQIGRYGGDSDADHEQPEAAGRCGLAAGAGRAIAARYHRPGERQRSGRAHFDGAGLH